MLSVGLMSGTSMDGIDVALLETDGSAKIINDLGNFYFSYDSSFKLLLKAAEYTIRKYTGNLSQAKFYFRDECRSYLQQEFKLGEREANEKLTELSFYLPDRLSLDAIITHSTHLHALAVKNLLNKTGYAATQIAVIGYHGQVMFHRPTQKISVILEDGQLLADQLGIRVVNDFRSQDISLGGQGAPFAPLYHQALAIRDMKLPLVVINNGGIANITLISNANELDLIAFDTGAGNGLIDRLVRQYTKGKEYMDEDGKYGKRGRVHDAVLKKLYEHAIKIDDANYFHLAPPKALDIGDLYLIPELLTLSIEDACRTLEAFTADSIVNSLNGIKKDIPKIWVLSGGGWKNPIIRYELDIRLQQKWGESIKTFTADEMGWNNQAMEAQLFAYLAVRSLQNKPLSFPGTTGVAKPTTGGFVYMPNS